MNIVFIEQPIGVGFSTSNNPNDYISGDEKSAQEMYLFILGFYKVFPELQQQDFYLSRYKHTISTIVCIIHI